ncbi:hypothetical protein FBEOM_6539 [Fusarium beomiforme]|uniref:Mid2 domain-containing protein n=1 Tax=Fusarium beomiforme TaxID=44412 RepID=A0A9P5AIS6_9HYPO|nr:hypothetical protein FBEOM_6539 [Fusarium beomiforme]
MRLIAIRGLALTLLASLGSCDSKFIRPPEWDPKQDADKDMINNIHYDAGEKIPILYETDVKKIDFWIWQLLGDSEAGLQLITGRGGSFWEAQHDVANKSNNNDDTVYYFAIYASGESEPLAQSQYVNVSAPRPDKTETVTISVSASRTLSFSTDLSTMKTSIISATYTTEPTDSSSSEGTESTSDSKSHSGLSAAATGGVAAGATIGGLLILGGIGWLIWRRLARRNRNRTVAELPGDVSHNHHQHQPDLSRTKVELPGDPGTYPSGYARSPPGMHEAL